MTLPALFSNGRFRTVVAAIVILGALYAIINIFVLGGDDFVFKLNSFMVSPLAALTAILATHLWRQMKSGAQSRILWGGLFLGWICWAIAESLWAAYSLAGEDPYPSRADLFFLAGYISLSFGFISRLRRLLSLYRNPSLAWTAGGLLFHQLLPTFPSQPEPPETAFEGKYRYGKSSSHTSPCTHPAGR